MCWCLASLIPPRKVSSIKESVIIGFLIVFWIIRRFFELGWELIKATMKQFLTDVKVLPLSFYLNSQNNHCSSMHLAMVISCNPATCKTDLCSSSSSFIYAPPMFDRQFALCSISAFCVISPCDWNYYSGQHFSTIWWRRKSIFIRNLLND